MDRSYSEKKFPPSWCHWRIHDGSERSRKKKNTAPRWFEKQKKILEAKGGSWRSKKMETPVYQSNISVLHKSLDLLISSIINNNNNNSRDVKKSSFLLLNWRSFMFPLQYLKAIQRNFVLFWKTKFCVWHIDSAMFHFKLDPLKP